MSHQQTSLILKGRFLVDSIEFVPFPPIGDHILARYCKVNMPTTALSINFLIQRGNE